MTTGQNIKKAVIPLVQTVFLSKDSMGVKKIEHFKTGVFLDDIVRHADSVWLNGRYEIHFDYYGIEGTKLYKNKISLPLKGEMPPGWQQTDENLIDLHIEEKKLDVLSPYVLEFNGEIVAANLAEEKQVESIEKDLNLPVFSEENDAENAVEVSTSQYEPDKQVEKIVKEYADLALENKTNDLSESDKESAEVLSDMIIDANEKSDIELSDDIVIADAKESKKENLEQADFTETQTVKETEPQPDLKALKARALLKLIKRNNIEDTVVNKKSKPSSEIANENLESIEVNEQKEFDLETKTVSVPETDNTLTVNASEPIDSVIKPDLDKASEEFAEAVSANDNPELSNTEEISDVSYADKKVVAVSGLVANLKMEEIQDLPSIEQLNNEEDKYFFIKYDRIQTDGDALWQRVDI